MITNSDLKLAALVLHETTLLEAVPKTRMAAPRSGSDNTPTVSGAYVSPPGLTR